MERIELAMTKPTLIEKVSTAEAVDRLIQALKGDEGYYYSWQANIAVQFQDEMGRDSDLSDAERGRIHTASNVAAKNFLNLLIHTGEPDPDESGFEFDDDDPLNTVISADEHRNRSITDVVNPSDEDLTYLDASIDLDVKTDPNAIDTRDMRGCSDIDPSDEVLPVNGGSLRDIVDNPSLQQIVDYAKPFDDEEPK